MKALQYELPGNSLLANKEAQKLGVRDNRYGIYGDNGYQAVIEIKKRSIADDKILIVPES